MSDEKEAIRELKHYINITPSWKFKEYTFNEIDNYIKTALNHIEKLQKENAELKTDLKFYKEIAMKGGQ